MENIEKCERMTDNEIIKALKEILEIMLTMGDLQTAGTISKTLDLINRQKAEIERLKNHIQEGIDLAKQLPEMVATVKAQAHKEFAEKVLLYIPNIEGDTTIKCVEEAIKQTLKETVGDNNA